jgi:hypothetical protein
MTLKDVVEKLGLSVLTSNLAGDAEVTGGHTSDLLSDVMANGRPGSVWITMQTHQNILAVAKIKDLAGIIVVNGRRPDKDTIRKADEEKVTVVGTDDSAFKISGRLYRLMEEP